MYKSFSFFLISTLITGFTPAANAEQKDERIAQKKFEVLKPFAEMSQGNLNAHVEAIIPLKCEKAWAVFTDYENMARFLPGVELIDILPALKDGDSYGATR